MLGVDYAITSQTGQSEIDVFLGVDDNSPGCFPLRLLEVSLFGAGDDSPTVEVSDHNLQCIR